jgi:plastocyanin
MRLVLGAGCALALALSLACDSSGEGGREVMITQTDDGCTPESVQVATGEKLKLTAKNETGSIYEIEGENGTQLDEVIVPEGKTRSVGYTVPDEAGTYEVKCYQPGGVTTIIELVAVDVLSP